MSFTDLETLEFQVEALFTHDANGRIHSINELGGGPSPRFFFGRTKSGNLWRIRHDVPQNIAGKLEELAVSEALNDDLAAMPTNLSAFLEALQTDHSPIPVTGGPAYRFPAEIPTPTNVVRITRSSIHFLRRMTTDLREIEEEFDQREPRSVMIEDGAAVSICNSARLTDQVAEAGVDILEEYRGRGYAPLVVAAWAQTIRKVAAFRSTVRHGETLRRSPLLASSD